MLSKILKKLHSKKSDNKGLETDLDKLIDNAHTFDGKPLTGRDREVVKEYLQSLNDDR